MAKDPTAEAKRPLTFRVRPSTLGRLKRRAREAGVTQTALAERYLSYLNYRSRDTIPKK